MARGELKDRRVMGVKKLTSYSRLVLLTFGILVMGGCAPGPLKNGDSAPKNGTLIYQGGFSSSTVSGGAKIYLVNGLISLYLENYSAPSGTQYTVFLSTNANSDFYHTVLKASLGSQLYSTGLASPGTGVPFTQVEIRLNTSPSSTLFATAYLASVLPLGD